MRYRITCEATVTRMDDALVDPDELEERLDFVMDHLMVLDAIEPDLSAVLATGEVEVSLDVDVPDELEPTDAESQALAAGVGTIRTAYHEAGVATPGWEIHTRRTVIEPQDDGASDAAPAPVGV